MGQVAPNSTRNARDLHEICSWILVICCVSDKPLAATGTEGDSDIYRRVMISGIEPPFIQNEIITSTACNRRETEMLASTACIFEECSASEHISVLFGPWISESTS